MKKRFTFEVEEGKTQTCISCPFGEDGDGLCKMQDYIDCDKYNMHTLKLVENGEQATDF